MFKPALVIPCYNHERAIVATLESLRATGLPCVVVDDGSNERCRNALTALQEREASWVTVVRHPENRGKGAAVLTGLAHLESAGFTHAVQIDADGQHDTRDVPRLLAAAQTNPASLVMGAPIFDASIPRARLYGRYLTHVWVWINTLSCAIRDGMCGFRVYPISRTLAVCRRARLGRRMDFDPEVAVRLHWDGVEVVSVPTRVIYPADSVSHFRLWRDNALISLMHTRLFFGMLYRLPRLLARRITRARA